MSKHTPGPWHVVRENIKIQGNTSRVVWNIRSKFGPLESAWAPVAEVHGPKNEANVRLIAAAPEMLEVLEFLLAQWPENEDYAKRQLVVDTIAKAKGAADDTP